MAASIASSQQGVWHASCHIAVDMHPKYEPVPPQDEGLASSCPCTYQTNRSGPFNWPYQSPNSESPMHVFPKLAVSMG